MTHNDGTPDNTHVHADVMENGYFMQGRSECFTGDQALSRAKDWLANEITKDFQDYAEPSDAPDQSIRQAYITMSDSNSAWNGTGEAWEGEVTVPGNRPGYGVIMGYRLMWIDGDCDRTV